MRRLFVALPLVLVSTPSPDAEACSQSVCYGAQLFPAPSTTVPANIPAFEWRPAYDDQATDPNNLIFTDASDNSTIGFTATRRSDGTFEITPSTTLPPGSYRLSDTNQCNGTSGPLSSFTLGPAAPLPSQLGMLSAHTLQRGSLDVVTAKGSCSEHINAASVDVQLALAADAQPWAAALHYETLVDGKPYRASANANQIITLGESWVGRGKDRVIARCDGAANDGTFSGVEPGVHEIVLRATLPGTQLVLTSSSVIVDLQCSNYGGDAGFGDHPHDDLHSGCSTGGGTPGALGLALFALIGVTRRRLCRS
jgi:MYXO-CTERM domain-containing protein